MSSTFFKLNNLKLQGKRGGGRIKNDSGWDDWQKEAFRGKKIPLFDLFLSDFLSVNFFGFYIQVEGFL